MNKKLLVLPLILMSAIGCSKKEKEEVDVVKYVGLKVYDPVYVAIDKGFFEAEGVKVELVDTVAGGATATQMVASNDVQAGLLSTMAIINAVNSGLPIIGVADIQSAFTESPLEEFYVRKDSGITSIQDLKGKTIAINLVKSSFHYTWEMMLRNNGMSQTDVNYVNLSFAEQEAALVNKSVDAIGLMQPYTKSARENPDLVQLYNAVDCFGERQFCEIMMNTNFISSHRESAEKFVTAVAMACNWVGSHQLEAKKIISKYTGIDVNKIDDYKFQPNGMCDINDAQYWLDFMKDYEGVKSSLTVSDIVTNSLNKL